ncbi:DUF2326 domain-containing protein [Shewanella sp. DNRA4]|uniref:DUF2326 domain-containing protein n=1 Tax=Shewanella sp. DNRA4 TaxID=2723055 RepID=UPI00146D1509|nr:DUF2326 domain-containing protein [Shewanella sp. DNRA4]NMD52692.1 DUF2326 domain-containing protein [Shewanella sp. DNRA4]
MKLLKLYSDNPGFKSIIFKPGLNIVAGLQSSALSTDSYNGIGKSSSLHLVHLMFGGKFDDKIPSDRKLKKFLSSYGNFYLNFSVGTSFYTVRKNFAVNDYFINDEKVSKTAYPKKLNEIFNLVNRIDFNFKPLFNIFARRYLPERSYYAGALTQQGQPPHDYYQMLYNLTLLGVETKLIKKNKVISDNISKLKKIEQELNKQKLTINEGDYLDLKDELIQLEDAKSNFIIAQNYDELKRQADILTFEMNALRNTIYYNEREISKKSRLLKASDHEVVDISRVAEIYAEAKFHFREKVEIQLRQAEEFHLNLQKARKTRLQEQIVLLGDDIALQKQLLLSVENRRDHLLKDLDSKGALEEYNSIVERIRTLESDIAELTSYQTLLAKFDKDKANLEVDKATVRADSVKQIEDSKSYIDQVEGIFRQFVKRFYRGHGGSLKITNSKDAQYLFNIDVHIPKDGSQGINEVKIFCYDMLLFSLNPDLLGFVAHDSCIFSGVDPRQVAQMFKVVLEMVNVHDLQYFVNINKDTYEVLLYEVVEEGAESILTREERNIIKASKVLELYDADPKNTLFGFTFG